MESVAVALITGVLTLAGVQASNSRSRAVMEQKIEALTRQVEKHNSLVERTYILERDVTVVRNEVEALKRGKAMTEFLTSNEWQWRLARTFVQGVLGVLVANLDLVLGWSVLDPAWRTFVAALVMATLSPVMAELGGVAGGSGEGGSAA